MNCEWIVYNGKMRLSQYDTNRLKSNGLIRTNLSKCRLEKKYDGNNQRSCYQLINEQRGTLTSDYTNINRVYRSQMTSIKKLIIKRRIINNSITNGLKIRDTKTVWVSRT